MKWEYLQLKIIAFFYAIFWLWDPGAFLDLLVAINEMEKLEIYFND